MTHISAITLFPEMFQALDASITGRAQRAGLLRLDLINPRDFTDDPHQTVDDRPYGGGPGMVMKVAPIQAAITQAKQQTPGARVIHLTPQGKPLQHTDVAALAGQNLILLTGRYEGIDERLITLAVDQEISIGDYVLSGGELPAMVLIDALTRQLPGALGHAESADQDSFSQGLLDCPHYTRPEEIARLRVPRVLLSGDHQAIARWREKQALGRTSERRPDLLAKLDLTQEQQQLLQEYKTEDTDHD